MTLIEAALEGLALWEGVFGWLYVDTKGYVTTAIGHMLPTPAAAVLLPLTLPNGSPASDELKAGAWTVVARAPKGLKEAAYAKLSTLRLSREQCFAMARGRLEREFLPGLRVRLHGFDGFPAGVQLAIVDVAWNYGLNGLARTHSLFPALEAHDWARAAKVCPLLDSRPDRNGWRARKFLEVPA